MLPLATTPFAGRTIPVGSYANRNAQVSQTTAPRYPVYGNAGLSVDEDYDGTRQVCNGGVTWRPRYERTIARNVTRMLAF